MFTLKRGVSEEKRAQSKKGNKTMTKINRRVER